MKLLVITPKDAYATRRLKEEAVVLGIAVDFVDIKELAAQNFNVDIKKYHVLYVRQIYPYFTEMEKLIGEFVRVGKRVVDANLSDGIDVSKWVMYQELVKAALPIPQTRRFSSLRGSEDKVSFPLVLKWQYGFGADHVFLVNDTLALSGIAGKYPREELLVQEYIDADCEYKVITVGYKSFPAVTKYGIHPVKKVSDLEAGILIEATTVPRVVDLAERAAQVMGRELAKVDILQKGSEFYILEVNRNPGLEPFEKVTGQNAARAFLEYMIL